MLDSMKGLFLSTEMSKWLLSLSLFYVVNSIYWFNLRRIIPPSVEWSQLDHGEWSFGCVLYYSIWLIVSVFRYREIDLYISLLLLLLLLGSFFSYFNNFCPDQHYFYPSTASEIGLFLFIQCLKDHCERIYLNSFWY